MNFNHFSLHIGSGLFASQMVDVFGGLFLRLIGAGRRAASSNSDTAFGRTASSCCSARATRTNAATRCYPVVQYFGQDGGVVSFDDRTGGRASPLKIGDTVPLRYLPGRATTAVIDHGLGNWNPVGWLTVLGIMLTGLGLVALRSP